jgi:hypothetical protein
MSMKNTTKYDTVEAAPYYANEPVREPVQPAFGTLRIAKVTYDHHPITKGGMATLGEMIDTYIADVIKGGGYVSEVTLSFETHEDQQELAALYR